MPQTARFRALDARITGEALAAWRPTHSVASQLKPPQKASRVVARHLTVRPPFACATVRWKLDFLTQQHRSRGSAYAPYVYAVRSMAFCRRARQDYSSATGVEAVLRASPKDAAFTDCELPHRLCSAVPASVEAGMEERFVRINTSGSATAVLGGYALPHGSISHTMSLFANYRPSHSEQSHLRLPIPGILRVWERKLSRRHGRARHHHAPHIARPQTTAAGNVTILGLWPSFSPRGKLQTLLSPVQHSAGVLVVPLLSETSCHNRLYDCTVSWHSQPFLARSKTWAILRVPGRKRRDNNWFP